MLIPPSGPPAAGGTVRATTHRVTIDAGDRLAPAFGTPPVANAAGAVLDTPDGHSLAKAPQPLVPGVSTVSSVALALADHRRTGQYDLTLASGQDGARGRGVTRSRCVARLKWAVSTPRTGSNSVTPPSSLRRTHAFSASIKC